MIGAAFTIAAVTVAAFDGPTWAWVVLAGLAVLTITAELGG